MGDTLRSGDVPRFGPDNLTFYSWHQAPVPARIQLRDWVRGMRQDPDGETGGGPEGAGAWLDEKISLSIPEGLFLTFLAVHCDEVVWTGSIVEDDRNVKAQLAEMGHPVDAFFGLFNTRHDLRFRGIGWTGTNHVDRHVRTWITGAKDIRVALFTAEPAAERHYKALGFHLVGDIYIPAFNGVERTYIKDYIRD